MQRTAAAKFRGKHDRRQRCQRVCYLLRDDAGIGIGLPAPGSEAGERVRVQATGKGDGRDDGHAEQREPPCRYESHDQPGQEGGDVVDEVADLLADGVLHEQRVGGDAEHDVARARVRVEEPHVLPQHGVQVCLPERDHLPLPGVHPARNLWKTRERSFSQCSGTKIVPTIATQAIVYGCSKHAAGMDAGELACRIRRHENETNMVQFARLV